MMSLLIQAAWLRGDIRSKLSGILKESSIHLDNLSAAKKSALVPIVSATTPIAVSYTHLRAHET